MDNNQFFTVKSAGFKTIALHTQLVCGNHLVALATILAVEKKTFITLLLFVEANTARLDLLFFGLGLLWSGHFVRKMNWWLIGKRFFFCERWWSHK